MFSCTDAKVLSYLELSSLVSESVLNKAGSIDAIAYKIDPEFAGFGFLEHYNIDGNYAANSLVFAAGKNAERKYALILTPASIRLTSQDLKNVLGPGKWSMASPDEVTTLTSAPLGSVGPFEWSTVWPSYINSALFTVSEIVVGGSTAEVKFVVDPNKLLQLGFQSF